MPKKAVIFNPGNKHRAKLIMNTIQWVLRVFQFLHYLLKVVVYGFYPKTRLSDEEHRLQHPFSKIVHVVALICYIQNRFFVISQIHAEKMVILLWPVSPKTFSGLVLQPAMIPYSVHWIFLASSSYPFSPCHDLFYGCSSVMAACCHWWFPFFISPRTKNTCLL